MAIVDINGNVIATGGSGTSQSELQRKFKDKNIVWIGDSIHAYTQPDGVTIPYLFQYNTGAKCYNWAQGGTTMALMNIANYDAFSGIGMVDCLTTRDFTNQETHMSDRGFTKQVAEMKEFDFSKADYVIIELGTNDNMKLVDLDNAENPLDTHTTGGALRYMIKTLLTYNPKFNIAVCNIQDGVEGRRNEGTELVYVSKDRNEIIESVCDELKIPLIDIFYLLGLNEYTKSTLTSDGLHRSHQGKLKQAKLIENQMNYYF